jgi:hypothetical protein
MAWQSRTEAPESAHWQSVFAEKLPAPQASSPAIREAAGFAEQVLEANALLDAQTVDLKEITAAVRKDSGLTQGIIRFSPLLADPPHLAAASLEEVAVLLGSKRLRLALISSALLDERGRLFSAAPRKARLRHALLSAFACERLARWSAFHDAELAYLAGLLHHLSLPAGGEVEEHPTGLRPRRGVASPEVLWPRGPLACAGEEAERLAPGGRALAAILEERRRRSRAPAEFLLEHLVMAACAVSRARAAAEAAALPLSHSVMQDMVSDALAPCLPGAEPRERARLSLELQVALDSVAAFLDASSLWPEGRQTTRALLPAVDGGIE